MLDAPAIIRTEAARVLAVASADSLDAPVPHLGRWTLRSLVAHLGGIHRWATDIVATRAWDGSMATASDLDGDDLRHWFADGAERLAATLAAADPGAACPNFSPGSPAVVAFWTRRQAHETTMHRWDAEAATGAPSPIDADVALDGIDEALHVFTRSRGKQDLAAPIALRSGGRTWVLVPSTVKPGRVEVAERAEAADRPEAADRADVAATIEAPAEAMLLALWRRPHDAAALTIGGDADVARRWLTGPLTP